MANGRMGRQRTKLDGQLGGRDFHRFETGKTYIRLLPYPLTSKPGDEDYGFYIDMYRHFNVGETGDEAVTCPVRTSHWETEKPYGDACPLCDYVASLRASGAPEDSEQAGQVRAKPRMIANALVRHQSEKTEHLEVVDAGPQLADQLLDFCMDEDGDYGDPLNPDTGRAIIVTRTGTGRFDTNYRASLVSEKKVGPIADKDLAAAPDLEDFIKMRTPEEIEALIPLGDGGGDAGFESGDDAVVVDYPDDEDDAEQVGGGEADIPSEDDLKRLAEAQGNRSRPAARRPRQRRK